MNITHFNFDSLASFYKYICETPYNAPFAKSNIRSSIECGYDFTGTKSYDEAVDLFLNGWQAEAEILTQKLKDIPLQTEKKSRISYDVVGHAASVPRFIQGIPTNMVHKKTIQQKKKIVTVVKDITYPSYDSKEKIQKAAIKTLHEVKTLETQGYAVNLYIMYCTEDNNGDGFFVRIKIKSANERLNISKVAFPLVHPSMQRRLFFRFTEVVPVFKANSSIIHGYGRVIGLYRPEELKPFLKDGELYRKY